MLTSPTAPPSRSIRTRYLNLAPGIQIGFNLHSTSVDKKYAELNFSCPCCLHKAVSKRFCDNVECAEYGEIKGDPTKAYSEGTDGVRIEVRAEDLEALVMPPKKNDKGHYVGKPSVFPDVEHILLHSRLSEKNAEPYLHATRTKYFLAPEKGASVSLYSTLQEALKRHKMCLMVKFCIGSKRQQLGIIYVEDNMLVMAEIPFAAQLRTVPVIKRTTPEKQFVDAMIQVLEQTPDRPYEEAVDDFQIAFDYLIENKTRALMEAQLPVDGAKKATKKPAPLETALEKLLLEASAAALQEKPTKDKKPAKV